MPKAKPVPDLPKKITLLIEVFGEGTAEKLAAESKGVLSTGSISRYRNDDPPSRATIVALMLRFFNVQDEKYALKIFNSPYETFKKFVYDADPDLDREEIDAQVTKIIDKREKVYRNTTGLYIRTDVNDEEFKELSTEIEGEYWVYHYWKNPDVINKCCWIAKRLLKIVSYEDSLRFIKVKMLSTSREKLATKKYKNFDYDGIAFPTGDNINFILQSRFKDYEILTITITKSASMAHCCGILSGRTNSDGKSGPSPAASFVVLVKVPEGIDPTTGVGDYYSPDDNDEFGNDDFNTPKLLAPEGCQNIKTLLLKK
jgi:hypothetical protein